VETKPSTADDARVRRRGVHVTLLGSLANLLLAVIKAAAGVLSGSQALVADAVHSLSDLVTDAVVLVGLHWGGKHADDTHHFGHGRIETIASALVAVVLISVGLFLGVDAARSILHGESSRPGLFAVVAAAISIVVKEALYHVTLRVGRRIGSSAVLANAWHHRSDALSSVAALVGAGAAYVDLSLAVLDAWAAGLVAFLVIKVGLDLLWQTLRELSDAAPSEEVVSSMRAAADTVDGVRDVHGLRARSIGGVIQAQLHVVVDGDMRVTEGHRIAHEVSRRIRAQVSRVQDVTVHIEPDPEDPGRELP
jgi:cation diffusion facilitator family transporter